jgi:hypothetical protein
MCPMCPLDSGSFFVSFSTLLVPLEVETSEFFSVFKRGRVTLVTWAHGAVCVQSQVKSHDMKLISNK